MSSVPVTFLFDFELVGDPLRPYVMHEFAANGAKNLVLSGPLIAQIMQTPALQKTLLKEMETEGLSFLDAHAPSDPYRDINSPVPTDRPQILARLKLAFQIAADMGMKTITVHIGNEPFQPGFPLEMQYDCVRSALAELLPCAESLGLILCIENIYYQLNTPERLLALKEEFSSDFLGLCYDSGHANLMDNGRRFPESEVYAMWGSVPPRFDDRILEKMLPHMVNCHLHDNDGVSDAHRMPGRGSVNWKHIAELLARAPRLKVIQSEVHMIRSRDSIREVCETFRKLGLDKIPGNQWMRVDPPSHLRRYDGARR